jgi:hypothetical protein
VSPQVRMGKALPPDRDAGKYFPAQSFHVDSGSDFPPVQLLCFPSNIAWHAACIKCACRQRKGNVELRNRWVHFKVSDVHIPNAEQVLIELYGDHLLQGRVMDISEGGKQGKFAVVKVDGIGVPVIISVDRILGVL